MAAPYNKIKTLLICVMLSLATFIVYEQVSNHDFVNYDDVVYVFGNQHVKAGLTPDSIKWAFTSGYAGNWHPLTWLSHMLDWQLFGSNPAGHHIINLVFHIANTLLLFLVLKQMTNALWQSAFVAALFALHPLYVESVAWIAERKNVLSTFFWMLTILAYLRYVKHPDVFRYLLMLLFFALGLMAKPMLVTLPFVLLLLDYWPLRRFPQIQAIHITNRTDKECKDSRFEWRILYRLTLEKVPFLVLSAISSIITFLVQQSSGAMKEVKSAPFDLRIFNALVSYITYIAKMFYPSRLAVLYPYPVTKLPVSKPLLCLLVLVAITVITIYTARRRPYLLVGWLWYLGTLVPVIGLVQIGAQAMADRYTYLPSIGIFIMVTWGAAELFGNIRSGKIVLATSAATALAALMFCTRMQLRYWQNDITLFGRAVEVTRDNDRMHNNYGNALRKEGRYNEAIEHFKQSLSINPDNFSALNNLGASLLAQGKFDEAVENFEKAMRSNPDDSLSYYNIAMLKIKQKQYSHAIRYLEEALRRSPDWPEVCSNLAESYFSQGDIKQAVYYWRRALELNPQDTMTLNNLAWILATNEDDTIRNPNDALKYAGEISELVGPYQQPVFLDTLAAAYAANGNFTEAVRTLEEAVRLAESAGKGSFIDEIRPRLELYKSGKPYREK